MNETVVNIFIVLNMFFAMVATVMSYIHWQDNGSSNMLMAHKIFTILIPMMFYFGPLLLIMRGHY